MGKLVINLNQTLKNIFAISLASKNMMKNDIDIIFDKNKLIYMEYYKKSDIYKTVLNKSLNFETEKYTEKIVGIIECYLDTGKLKEIEILYKKAFKKIYINTKNLKRITIYDIAKYLSEGIEGTFEAFSTLYIYSLNNKFDMNDFNNEDLFSPLQDIIYLNNYIVTNFSSDAISLFKNDLVELSTKLGLKKKMYTLEELITDILSKDVENYNKSIVASRIVDIQSIQKYGNVGKYVGAMEGTFKYLQIDSARLAQNTIFTQKEVNNILLNYIYAKKFNFFTDKDLASTIIPVIYFTALNKEYKKLKNDYLKNVNEEHLLEVDKLQKDLISSKNEFDRLTENTKIKEKSLIDNEKYLISEIENLKKENSRLKNEVNESEDLKQEVIKLRNILFNAENKEEIIEIDNDIDIDIDKLKDLNIVIVGGNIAWVKKIKVQFPNWNYIGMEQLNNDFSTLKNSDFIFINIKMKHALYFKVKNFISKFNIKYDYLESLDNISMNIEDIYSKLKSESLI